jgi:hypothetical protein
MDGLVDGLAALNGGRMAHLTPERIQAMTPIMLMDHYLTQATQGIRALTESAGLLGFTGLEAQLRSILTDVRCIRLYLDCEVQRGTDSPSDSR